LLAPWRAGGQTAPAPVRDSDYARISVEAGAVAATAFAEDGNGVTVRARPGAFVGGAVSVSISRDVAIAAGVRASTSALRLESPATEWRGGTTSQADLRIGVETRITRALRLSGAGVVARASGPRHVVPFRAGRGSVWMWGAELAGAMSLPGRPRLAVIVVAGASRLGSSPRAEPPIEGGWIGQLRLGVRGDIR
jgi:hypothetical protein